MFEFAQKTISYQNQIGCKDSELRSVEALKFIKSARVYFFLLGHFKEDAIGF